MGFDLEKELKSERGWGICSIEGWLVLKGLKIKFKKGWLGKIRFCFVHSVDPLRTMWLSTNDLFSENFWNSWAARKQNTWKAKRYYCNLSVPYKTWNFITKMNWNWKWQQKSKSRISPGIELKTLHLVIVGDSD